MSPPEFWPRFPISEVGNWANRYQYADDAKVERVGRRAARRGCYRLADLLVVAQWKTRGRSARYCEVNADSDVRRATAFALTTTDERERVAALVRLHGVQLPTASVLLHIALADRFPIIDYRALWSLGVDDPPASYSFDYWWAYVEACRSLKAAANVDMRRLDRGLWQFSKEHQPPRHASSAEHAPAARRTHPASPVLDAGSERAMDKDFNVPAYTRLVAAAIEGRLIVYSDVAGRGQVARYLYRIAQYEKAHSRPPLTALVVHKQDGRPGQGFRTAMEQVGYVRPGESDPDLWRRAVRDVFAYWKP